MYKQIPITIQAKHKMKKKSNNKFIAGAKIFGVFRVKNHEFTPKNHIFFNCGGRRGNFWGVSCEKSFHLYRNYRIIMCGLQINDNVKIKKMN